MGVLYGQTESLEQLNPLAVGGETIVDVRYSQGQLFPHYLSAPERFEPGLQNFAGIIGSGAAVDYLSKIGMDNIHQREKVLVRRLYKQVSEIDEINIVGPQNHTQRSALVAFYMNSE